MNNKVEIILLVRSVQRLLQSLRLIRRMCDVYFPSIGQMQQASHSFPSMSMQMLTMVSDRVDLVFG